MLLIYNSLVSCKYTQFGRVPIGSRSSAKVTIASEKALNITGEPVRLAEAEAFCDISFSSPSPGRTLRFIFGVGCV